MKIRVQQESRSVDENCTLWIQNDIGKWDNVKTGNVPSDYSNLIDLVLDNLPHYPTVMDRYTIEQALDSMPTKQLVLANGNFESTWEIDLPE